MAGARQPFSIDIDDAELRRTLQTLIARVQTPRDALREIGEVLYLLSIRKGSQAEVDRKVRAGELTPW